MKLYKRIFASLLCLLFIFSGCTKKETDAMKFKQEYESLNGTIREKDGKTIRTISIDEENPILYASDEDIVNKIQNKETFVVYFGFADCPWCRSMVPTLLQVAKDMNVDKIYYCDVKDIRDTYELDENNQPIQTAKGSNAYPQLLEAMDEVLENYTLKDESGNEVPTGEKRIYAPNLVVFVNGQAKALTSGNSEKQSDGYMELSEEILKDSYQMIQEAFQTLSDTSACAVETKC